MHLLPESRLLHRLLARPWLIRRCLATAKLQPKPSEEWHGVVGLEIHAQISSKSKLFSGSATTFSAPTNSTVSLFDCATPGTLPVLNRRCVEAAVLTALSLNCALHPVSSFDRKHYFYADLPAGYQITQRFNPIATDGHLDYPTPQGERRVNIEQVQLEQDSGKSLHNPQDGYSLIDLNRAGIGLMEIITRPEFDSGEQAACFVRELVLVLRELGVCDVRMFEGSLRVDANVSVRRRGEPLGIRSEVKNIASMKFVSRAVDYEITRQIQLKESGEEVVNETRGYDFNTGATFPMRDKEILQDYRYMPEPNLPPLRLFDSTSGQAVPDNQIDLAVLRTRLPELPSAKRQRFINTFKLTPQTTSVLIAEEGLARLFDSILHAVKSPKSTPSNVATHLVNVVLATLNELHDTANRPVDAAHLARLIDMVNDELLPRVIFVRLMEQVIRDPECIRDVEEHVRKNDLMQVNDEETIGLWCEQVISAHPDMVELVRKGKDKIINRLTNEVKLLSGERANLRKAKAIMESKIKAGKEPLND